MLVAMDVVPGQGIDFGALGQVLLLVLGVYVAGVAARRGCRAACSTASCSAPCSGCAREVEDKLNRLPLRYFDGQPRGELLSRVTNDIDNIAQTLQQTLSQLLTSLLTVVGVLAMMFWISPLLALIALVTVPLSMLVTGRSQARRRRMFIAQWRHTGTLNAHIEETFTGHALVKVFGRQRRGRARRFAEQNEELYQASFGAQFISGMIMPAMMFIGNLNYVAGRRGRRAAGGHRARCRLGDVQAFIQYSRQFTQPLTQVASMANLLQSGVASAERVFELLDADGADAGPGRAAPRAGTRSRPGRVRARVVPLRRRTSR